MSSIRVSLPDGAGIELPAPATAFDLAARIGPRLAKAALAAEINGAAVGLDTPLRDGGAVTILTFDSEKGREVFRHSTSHVMAAAIKRLYPQAKLAIGPAIEDGFYYDIDVATKLTEDIFPSIEAEMEKIVREDVPFVRREVTKAEALALFRAQDDVYKLELLDGLDEGPITLYETGGFVDLCRGPHLRTSGAIKAFKLQHVAGAYWRGDEKRPMLQRIYGTSFPGKKELEEHLKRIEEAERRDHRKLGKQLDLFSFHEEAPGFPFFHPKGMVLLNELLAYWRVEHRKRGYGELRTPLILNRALWEQSGHWDHYKENMYFTQIDDREFAVKPMNCPGGMLIYKTRLRSYRDLPLRWAELGTVHRHEKSGVLHGLTRVRMFTQDDAHIFMTPEQIQGEVTGVIDFVDAVYKTFGLEYSVELSTRPDKSIGTDEMWETATSALRRALEGWQMAFKVNEGDGAFYGPKIDFHVKDSLKRSFQCATIQLDFAMPEKFHLEYTGQDGHPHRPVMIHRVVYGSVERFIGILIEHFGGAFPAWLAPVQAVVIPVSDAFAEYAQRVADDLEESGFRAEADLGGETMQYKIRHAQTLQVPYMLVTGKREQESGLVAVRHRRQGDLGAMPPAAFTARLAEEVASKALDSQ